LESAERDVRERERIASCTGRIQEEEEEEPQIRTFDRRGINDSRLLAQSECDGVLGHDRLTGRGVRRDEDGLAPLDTLY
jgi:hypothetical protein